MTEDIQYIVSEIDKEIRLHKWFDFHILKYESKMLSIAGSIDLLYYHTLEIVFEDIFFVSGFFQGWHTDTSKTAFRLESNQVIYKQYEIEQGYRLFIFNAEDYQNEIIISAKSISFNTDTVYYYERPNLKDNERVAEFVKKKNSQ